VRPALSRHLARRVRPALLAVSAVVALGVAGCDVTEDADLERGRALFQQKCSTCHALAQAGAAAEVGPNLDASFAQARADGMDDDTVEGVVQKQIENPRVIEEGVPNYTDVYMPPDLVTGQDAEDVAAYVGTVAGVPGAAPPQLDPPDLFVESCGSCHAFSDAGTSATVGPDLDEVLAGKDAKYIEQQIVDPGSEITPGYQDGIMPANFETSLTPEDLKGLVDYLSSGVNGGGAAKQ
jgi:mono/diheme cytochrome c family protein